MLRTHSVCSILSAITAVLLAGLVAAGCGGDEDGEASAADLKPLLPPPSQLARPSPHIHPHKTRKETWR
jgi:hypothetical protein